MSKDLGIQLALIFVNALLLATASALTELKVENRPRKRNKTKILDT